MPSDDSVLLSDRLLTTSPRIIGGTQIPNWDIIINFYKTVSLCIDRGSDGPGFRVCASPLFRNIEMEKFYLLSYDSLCNFARAGFFVRLCGLLSVLIQWWQLLLEMLLMRPHYTTPHRCLRLTWPAQQQQQHNSRDWGDTVSSVVTRLWSSVDPEPLPHGQNEVYFIGEKFYFFI